MSVNFKKLSHVFYLRKIGCIGEKSCILSTIVCILAFFNAVMVRKRSLHDLKSESEYAGGITALAVVVGNIFYGFPTPH